MENSRDNQENIEQKNKLPKSVIEAISVQNGRNEQDVENEMAEAIKKMNKLIEDKVFLLQHENEGLVIDPSQISATKDKARVHLINAMLNQRNMDEIDEISNTVALESLKPIIPEEIEETIATSKRKEEVIMDYIASNVNTSRIENESTKKMQQEAKIFANTYENLGTNAAKIIDELGPDLDEFVQKANENQRTLDQETIRGMKAIALGMQKLVEYADTELDKDARDDIFLAIATMTTQDDPIAEEILVKLSKMIDLDVLIKDENGKSKVDRDKFKEIYLKEVGFEYDYDSLVDNLDSGSDLGEGNLPKDKKELIKVAQRKAIESKLVDVVCHGTPEEIKSTVEKLAKIDLEYVHEQYVSRLDINDEHNENLDTLYSTLKDTSKRMMILTTNSAKDLIEFSGKELTKEQRITILKDMCFLATQDNDLTNSYLEKMAKTFNIDIIEKYEDGSEFIDRKALIEQYRKEEGDVKGEFTSEYFEKEAQKMAGINDKFAENPPMSYELMKRAVESRAKRLILTKAVLKSDDRDFENQINYLFEGDNQFAQDFLKEFLGEEFSRDPQYMNKIMVINNKIRERNISHNQLVTEENANPKTQLILLTSAIKDLSLYPDGDLSEEERYAVLIDMCRLATHDTKITNKILLQMAEKFNIDITSKDKKGVEGINRKKLMEEYNATVEKTFNMELEKEDRVSIDYFKTEVESLTNSKSIKVAIPEKSEDILKMAEGQAKEEMFAQIFLGEVDDLEGKFAELVEQDMDYSREYIKSLLKDFDNMDPKFQDRVMKMSNIFNNASRNDSNKEKDSSAHVLSANDEALNNLKKSTNMFKTVSGNDRSVDDDGR